MKKIFLLVLFFLIGCSSKSINVTENKLNDLHYPNHIYNSLEDSTIQCIINNDIDYSLYQNFSQFDIYNTKRLNDYILLYNQSFETSPLKVINQVNNPNFLTPSYQFRKPALYQHTTDILVNKTYYLDKNYIPNNLIEIPIEYTILNKRNILIKEIVYQNFLLLYRDAKKYNFELKIYSGYRSFDYQSYTYERNDFNDDISARPGHSEHQTGYALDISTSYFGLTENFGSSKEGIFLKEHAHEYGFIIRYQKNKENITGFHYEPWHLRYIGKDTATFIYNNNISYEEYIINNKEID